MGAIDPGLKAAAAAARKPAAAPAPRAGRRLALGILVGLMAGVVAGYGVASRYFNEQLGLLTQAADLRVAAAQQRIREVEQQQREFIKQADAQQREIIAQSQEQELAFLQRANERERKLAQPDLPVRVWMRPPLLGPRLVARLHNFGTKELTLAVAAHRATSNAKATWQIVLAPNGTQELGGDGAWSFAPGDDIDLAQSGFRPMTFHVRPRAAQAPGAPGVR
jgi:hypothetical protein